jgi:hypothetical protein
MKASVKVRKSLEAVSTIAGKDERPAQSFWMLKRQFFVVESERGSRMTGSLLEVSGVEDILDFGLKLSSMTNLLRISRASYATPELPDKLASRNGSFKVHRSSSSCKIHLVSRLRIAPNPTPSTSHNLFSVHVQPCLH